MAADSFAGLLGNKISGKDMVSMGIFNIDSPLMQALGKVADLMWLNLLTLICCIPIVTIGASLTAMHYVALKMARGEDYYVTRGFFKSFKENFKQATIIWLLLLLMIVFLYLDFVIMSNSATEFPFLIRVVVMVVAFLVLLTSTFLFPSLARFENTVFMTIKNAFMMSILQFPKTLLMIVINVLPVVLFFIFPQIFPIIFLFGLSAPAFACAHVYNKFFRKLEDHIRSLHPQEKTDEYDEDEKIFHDEVLVDDERTILEREGISPIKRSSRKPVENSPEDSPENSVENSQGKPMDNSLEDSPENSVENSQGKPVENSLESLPENSLESSLEDSMGDIPDKGEES